jgi:alcohol dehydrogenase class IV
MALETIDTLLDAGHAPRGLRNLGVREEDLPGLAARALDDVCLLTSPRQTDAEDLLGILKRSY